MMKVAILEHHLKSASVRHNRARIQQARDTIYVSQVCSGHKGPLSR